MSRAGTLQRHVSAWAHWEAWSEPLGVSVCEPNLGDVLDFLFDSLHALRADRRCNRPRTDVRSLVSGMRFMAARVGLPSMEDLLQNPAVFAYSRNVSSTRDRREPPPPACVSHRHGASCAGSRLPRHRDPCLGRFPCLRLGQPSFWRCTAVQSQPLDSGAGCGQRLVLAHQNFPDRSSLGIIGRRFLGPSARGLGASLAPRTPRLRGAGASGHGPGLLGP